MRALAMGVVVVAAQLLTGCATIRLPLCPAIAERSYPPGQAPGRLNADFASAVERRGIKVEVLSPFAANFRGLKTDIAWLVRNYPQLVCGFDPKQVDNPRSTYISCTAHAPQWAAIGSSKNPEQLMMEGTLFPENCTVYGRPSP